VISVQILGQVSICAGTARANANGSKMWTVATMLASHPNTFVSIDRLVDEVWEHDPPVSAVANIRTYVSGLRRVLGPASGRISGQRTGYRLELEPSELDLSQFERLVGEGRTALGNGDPAESALSLHRALTLFPGPALVGVRTGGALTGVAGMLAEQRLSAMDDLYSAELALGHHADMVSPLRRHVRAHPLRERGWAQLMVALYRCGDPAAALAAFGQARAVLITELGIEPGVHLRSLQRAVLRRAAELDLPGGAPAPVTATPVSEPRTSPPRELPRTTQWFTGRESHLLDIRRAFDRADRMPPVIAIHGPSGTGASTLAIRAAHGQADAYPDGLLYLDMRESGRSLTATDAAHRLLTTLDPAATGSRVFARLRSALNGQRVLIVLDNVSDAGQVAPLMPSTSGVALLVASGRMLSALDAHHVSVGRFTPLESFALLRAVAGAARVDADPEAAASVTVACGHLPIAIRIAGGRLASRPEWGVADLAHRLRDERTRLDELCISELSVRSCLARNYAGLTGGDSDADDPAHLVLTELGERPATAIYLPDVAAHLNTSTRDAEATLMRLVDVGLLDVTAPGRYAPAPLVREFASELATADLGTERQPAILA
jgi:DNA-binding SARP family transcriptional activator